MDLSHPKNGIRLGDMPSQEFPLWSEAQIELLWDDPALLGLYIGKDLQVTYTGDRNPIFYDGKNVPDGLHSMWIKALWLPSIEGRDSAVMAHRNSLKTTSMSEIGTIWNWTLKPFKHNNDRVMLVRGNFTAATSSKNVITRNMKHPVIVSLFETLYGPGCTDTVFDRDNETLYKFKETSTKEGSITAWGILQDFTGFHCDRVLGDDFVTRESQYSRAIREKTIVAVQEIQANIKDKNGGSCHWIGTPWHENDAWTVIPDPIKFAHRTWTTPEGVVIPGTNLMSDAEYEDAIWGTRKDGKRYRKISPSQEAANYALNPNVRDSGMLFAELAEMGIWQNGIRDVVSHIDCRYDGNHWTALTIAAKLPDGKIQITGFAWEQHVDSLESEILGIWARYRVRRHTQERNPDKGYSMRRLEAAAKRKGLKITFSKDKDGKPGYMEGTNKHRKIIAHLLPAWGNLVWDADCQEDYLDQILNYMEGEEPDDAPDSAASLLREFYDETKANSQDWRWK